MKNIAFILHLCLLLSLLPAQMATAQTQTDDGGNLPAQAEVVDEEAPPAESDDRSNAAKDTDIFAFLD
ncbi:MAG: hypothetical protein PVJ10_03155, partial [Thiohalophilus sp.]